MTQVPYHLFGDDSTSPDNFRVWTRENGADLHMNMLTYAILAALLIWGAIGIGPRQDVEPPRRVRFQLADGVRVSGNLTSWDAEGFDGSFGRRLWVELTTGDVWGLHVAVMDPTDAEHWINLGRVLLIMDGGQQAGERAFRRAERIDPEGAPRAIDEARKSAAGARRQQEALREEMEQQRLKTRSPESQAWPAEPWPPQSAQQRAAAVETLKTDAAAILAATGRQSSPVETDYFLLYTDMPRAEAAIWAHQLDKAYEQLAKIFRLNPNENIFWGKAVVLVFTDRDRFRLVEADAFGHLVPNAVQGICHFRGPQVFLNLCRSSDDDDFAAALVHEAVHGFMHRYRTPMRLPPWANEGLADYVVAESVSDAPMDDTRRRQALVFVRSGGSVPLILQMSYAEGSWPGNNAVGYAVGYLLVRLMLEDRPSKFDVWVNAIKQGKPWSLALAEEFGVPRDHLVETFVRFYRVND
jgi:hypothetical protein